MKVSQKVSQIPLFLSDEGQKLLALAVETVREECCFNGCKHCKSKRHDPLKCSKFKCAPWIIDCESFVSKAGA